MIKLKSVWAFFRKTKDFTTSKKEIFIQIVLVFILPVLLLQSGLIPFAARIWVLGLTVTLFIFILRRERWTLKSFHAERCDLKKFIIPYTIFTVVGVVIINILGESIGREEINRWWSNSHFIYLFLVVSIFQEVAYRGYLIPALKKITSSPVLVVLVNAILFTYMHSIFANPQINLPLAFVGGLGFAIMYLKYPNLLLIIISHSVLNFFAVLFGFFITR